MSEQEKFDDLLRSKLEERDFPFDETNWDKAEAIIERSENRRRFGFIAFVFSAGIIIGAGLMYFFNTNSHSSAPIAVQQAPQNNNTLVQANNLPIQQQTTQASANTSVATANTNTNSQETTTQVKSAPKENTNTTIASSGNETKHKKHAVPDSTTTAYSYVRPETAKTKKKKVHYTNYTQPEANSVAPPKPVNTNAYNKVTPANNSAANEATPVTNSNQANSTNTDFASTNNPIKQNSNSTTSTKDSTTKTDSTTTALTTTKKDSSTSNSSLGNTQPQPTQSAKYAHTIFSIDAGCGYSLGWMKAGATQGNGVSPVSGLSVTHYFSTKISALIGLQYNSLPNVNTLYTNNATQYSFGSSTDLTSVTIKTLYYLSLPLKFQYNINDKNMVSAGVNVLYLLTSNSNVVSYNQDYFGTSGYTSVNKMGYTDGINNWDAQATLAYRRRINRFSISAEFYYGLLDIESNSFFNNAVFERNSGLRLILSYDIIK